MGKLVSVNHVAGLKSGDWWTAGRWKMMVHPGWLEEVHFLFNIGWIFMLVRDWWVYRSEVNYLSFRVKLALGMREHAQERREGLQRP